MEGGIRRTFVSGIDFEPRTSDGTMNRFLDRYGDVVTVEESSHENNEKQLETGREGRAVRCEEFCSTFAPGRLAVRQSCHAFCTSQC